MPECFRFVKNRNNNRNLHFLFGIVDLRTILFFALKFTKADIWLYTFSASTMTISPFEGIYK